MSSLCLLKHQHDKCLKDHFFEKFDQVGIAQKLINTHPKYSGKTVDEVIKEWGKGAL